jgi:hypothetical protein
MSHLSKNIPCDFKCKICGEASANSVEYSRHQKKFHASNSSNKNNAHSTDEKTIVLDTANQQPTQQTTQAAAKQQMIRADDQQLQPHEIEEMRQKIDVIPIEDFNWEYLESIASKVEVTETYYNTVSRNNGENGPEMERVQGFERRTKLIFRAENAKRCLPASILSDILMCLDATKFELSEMMFKLLHDVHADRKEPRLLSIRGNDVNRKNVSIYSRPPPTDECYWIVNSNSVALKKTRDHCESLFNFTLVSAIEALVPGLTVKQGKVMLWLVCPYKWEQNGKTYQKAVTLIKDRNNDNALSWQNLKSKDLILRFESENEDYKRFLDMIRTEIETSKTEILDRLSGVELDDKRLNEFFELAKDASTGLALGNEADAIV